MKITIDKNGEVKITLGNYRFPKETCLQGYVNVSYKKLVKVFGKPNDKNDGYKTDAEWLIKTPQGYATIYNYKDGKNYLCEEGKETVDITEWHIGGENVEVARFIIDALIKN